MRNSMFGKKNNTERSGIYSVACGNRLRGLRIAGLFVLFICLMLSCVFGFGFNRSESEPLTANAATDWGVTWNEAVSSSTTESPKTVKLTSAWTTTSGTKTGAGFSNGRLYVPAGKNVILNLNGYTINRGLTSSNNYGSVFYVAGTLTLQGSGYIRGGYVSGTSSGYSRGGGIHIADGGVVTIAGPTVGLNKAASSSSAGGVYVATGGTLNMSSGNIGASGYANTASGSYSAGVYIANGAVFSMTGGGIGYNTASGSNSAGGVYIASDGTFDMKGGNITSNTVSNTNSAGGVYVAGTGVFNKTSGNVNSNTASNINSAGGVYVASSAKFTQSAGQVNSNTASSTASNANSAGGVLLTSGATFTQSGGTVNGNAAKGALSGGGVRVAKGGTFNMTGGNIRINTASAATSGGGVYLDGAMTNTGGQIGYYSSASASYANVASSGSGAGGVYCTENGSLSVGGSGSIYYNKTVSSFTKDIVFAKDTQKINVISTITSTSYRYGVYKTGTGAFTVNCGKYCTAPSSVFVVQNADYSVTTLSENNVTETAQLHRTNMAELWSYYVKRSIETKTQQTMKLTANWTATGSDMGSGKEFSSGRILVPADADIVLNLNGYTIDRKLTSASSNGNVFVVLGKLTIQGNTSSFIKGGYTNAYGGINSRGAAITVNGGTLNFNGGIISGNRIASYSSSSSYIGAGGIYVENGTVNMTGGYIGKDSSNKNTSSSASGAGGVLVGSGGVFNLSGGYIYNNTAAYTYSAGGVSVRSGGTFNMTGGYLRNNSASNTYSAGGVFLYAGATAKLTGGEIGNSTSYSNTASNSMSAGGIYVRANANISLGGSIKVYNNTGVVAPNLYFESNVAKATVVSAFSSAKVGVSRNGYADNYAVSGDKRNFTVDYSKYNTASPTTFFTADNLEDGVASHSIVLADNEASLFCLIGSANWLNAVTRSRSDGSVQTVKLEMNWVAKNGSLGSDPGDTAFSNGRIYLPADAKIILNLNGKSIDRKLTSANNYGTVIYVAGNLTIQGNNGSYIKGGYSNGYSSYARGSGIHLYNNAVVNMEGGVIAKNTSTSQYGAAVYVSSGAVFNFKGGYIGINSSDYNTSTGTESGGGVQVMSGGTFNMSCEKSTTYIYYNRTSAATSGAGVSVRSGGKFNMSGGYIRYNTASGATSGGGVYLAGTMVMTAGQIGRYDASGTKTGYGNTASHTSTGAGGIYYAASGSLSVGGASAVHNNISGTSYTKDIIFASDSLKITFVSAMTSTDYRFAVYKSGVGAFTKDFGKYNNESYYSTYFYNDNSNYTIGKEPVDGVTEVALVSKAGTENWSHAVQVSLSTKTQQTVTLTQDWNATNASFGNGDGYSNGRLYVPAGADIVLKMGSYSINRGITSSSTSNYGSVFYVVGTLTISGNNSSSYIRGGYANGSGNTAYGGGAHIANGGVLNLQSGIFAGNRSTVSSSGAGGIYVANGGTLNMTGGYIGYNTTSGSNITLNNFNYASGTNSAGGVYVASGGTFNMSGGYIRGNNAVGSTSAGGIYISSGGSVTLSAKTGTCRIGTETSSNASSYRNTATAAGSAGGIYVVSGGNLSLGNADGNGNYISVDNNNGKIAPNLYFASATGFATIVGHYSSNGTTYRIGVTRNGNADNYAVDASQRNITKNYSKYISGTATATNYFRSDATATHYVLQQDGEAILHCKTGPVNWENAVKRSLSDKSTQTVKLEESWEGVSGSMGDMKNGFSGGRIYLPATASIILDLNGFYIDRKLTSANNYGSVMYICGTLTLKGNSSSYIQGGYSNAYYSSARGGGIHIAGGGTVTMEGSLSVRKNVASNTYSAAGVYIASGAIFNLKSGYIGYSGYANSATATYSAGGVYVANGGVFNMTSGSSYVYYNKASNSSSAGGVYVADGGTFNMTSGYIRYNTAAAASSGAGVYLAGTMKMTGGQIGRLNATGYENTASVNTSAGGIYYLKSGKLSVGGSAVVANNKTAGSYTKDIVFVDESSKIAIDSDLTRDSYYHFGIFKSGVGAFTSGYGSKVTNTSYYNVTFKTQNSEYTLSTLKVNNVLEVALTSVNGTENWSQAVQLSLNNGGAQQTVKLTREWKADSNFSFGSGTGYSAGRIYVPAGANIVLNLGGNSISRGLTTANNYGNVFLVAGTLTIEGGNTSSIIRGGYGNGYYSTSRCGGIQVESGGVVNFKSGVIGSNKCNYSYGAGGVYVASGGTFNMSGGYIGYDSSTRNYSYGNYSGGGVYVASGGTFNMTGGYIRSNNASGTRNGAGIYAAGVVKLSSCQIGYYNSSTYANNATGTEGVGGIYVTSGSNLFFGGGSICVYNNTGVLAPNVYFASKTSKATITGTFGSSSYKIGVKRYGYADNYATDGSSNITNGWSKYNSNSVTNYFVCNDAENHKLIQATDAAGNQECAFSCILNNINWSNAVKKSMEDGKQKVVDLTAEWKGTSGNFSAPSGYDTGYSSGRLYVPEKADILLNLRGFTINRGLGSATNYGSVFYVAGSLILDGNGNSGSIVRGGYANSYYSSARGGGIHLYNNAQVIMRNNVTLRNNNSSGTYGAGGVYISNGATFTLQSSKIYYNYSTNTNSGAAAYVASGGNFIMESGTIYYNKASGNNSAGAVYLASGGTLNMKGGQIGNYSDTSYANISTPTNGAGGVYVASGGILNVGGSVNIRYNGIGSTVTYGTRDVYLVSDQGKVNVVSALTSTSYKIGVYRSGNGVITNGYGKSGNTTAPSNRFISENTTYSMLSEGSGDTLEGSLLSSKPAENWSYAIQQSLNKNGEEQTVTLTKNWTASGGNFTSGTNTTTGYSSGRLYVPAGANIKLNLNGYSVDRGLTSANNYGSVFYVAGTLTITGTSSSYIKGGYANGYYSSTRGAGIHIYNNGVVNMEGGAIVSNKSSGQYGAGGVYVSSGATFNMTGGYIGYPGLGNTATGTRSGAGVFVVNGGKFQMKSGCYIYSNTASGSYSAGGVYLDGNATFEMQGGYIGNYSSSSSTVYYNTASGTYSAGGVYNNGGTFKMADGYFYCNRATNTYSAGAVYLNNGTFEMTGGRIGYPNNSNYANYATNSAGNSVGGVYVNTNGKISLGGSAYLYYNRTYNRYTGDLYFVNANTSATVVSPFTNGARIGIYRTANVTTKSDGSAMTSGYSSQNPSTPSTNYFSVNVTLASGATDYRIIHENGEAYLYYLDPVTNWEVAVNTSSASAPKTVKLFANWTAATNSSYTTAFSTNSNSTSQPFYQGTLNVPTGRSVILDLNGYTINRNLTLAKKRANGYVLGVRGGTLKIIDSSTGKSGIIRGGASNSDTVGSGIHVASGTLTLEGGCIINNYGSYGVYVNSSSVINLGGDIGVYNNTNASNNPANIYLSLDSNLINIVSKITSDREIGITRTVPYDFTKGWGKYHGETVDPELHFTSDDMNFRIGPSGAGETTEVAILGNDNASNWQYAVTTSLKTGKTYTVQLTEDWSAGKNSTYGTAFGINTKAYYSGALYVPSGASIILDLNGCSIDRNLATGNVFHVIGKLEIVDQSAQKNGIIEGGNNGIYIYNGGTVTMNAGTVTGNANYGVYDYYGTFNLKGGTVGGNSNASVYVEKNGKINLGGKPVLDNGLGSGNLVLAYESTLIGITSQLQEGSKISFLRKGVGPLTQNWSKYNSGVDPWKYFTSESDVFLPSTEEVAGSLEASLISYDNNINWQYAVSSSLSSKTTKSMCLYEDWIAGEHSTYTTAFGTTSAYLNGALYVPKGASVVLDLSGFDLNRNLTEARANGYIIYVQGELKIVDSRISETEEGALITGGKNSSGSSAGAVYIASGGVFTLEGPQIVSNRETADSASAGAVYAAGTFNFNSGKIFSNAGANAGGVYIASSGKLNMVEGTEIVGNSANGNAGGGAVYAAGAFGFDGGEISANSGSAGGVYVASGGNLSFDNGKIVENNGTLAGGVYVFNSVSANFAMSGGEISGNKVSGDKTAGGIYAAGKVVVSGGKIVNNCVEEGSDNAGGVYVATTGDVTVTGGEISGNTGTNGLRAEGAATLSLGGSAVIKDNVSAAGEKRDVYLTNGERSINIVSKFEDGASIGIWRDRAGSFTKGYGIYNGAETGAVDPNKYFYSNKVTYNIFGTEVEEGESSEVAAGIPVAKPTAIGEADAVLVPVYDGNDRLIVVGYDDTKMSVGELPEGVKLTAEGFVALHAGKYDIVFTPGQDYCWPNGSIAAHTVSGVVNPKPVELNWSNLEFTYDGDPHKPDAEVTNLVGSDSCTVTVSGEQTNAGTYEASATALSNSDYTLEGGKDVTHEFIIHKAPMTLTFKEKTAVYKQALTLALSGNVENGAIEYSVEDMTGKAEIQGADVLMPTWVGEVKVTAKVAETTNYLAGTVSEVFTVEQADAPLELNVHEAVYGTPLTLGVKDYGEVGTLTFTIAANQTGKAEIPAGTAELRPLAAGTVDVKISVEATHNYKATTAVQTVTIKPCIVTLFWTELEFVYDGDPHCAKAEITNLVSNDTCNLEITGAQTDAGTYNATVKSLDNANYTLVGADEVTKEFVIHKANINPVVNTTEIVYKQAQKLDIEGNLGNGAVTLTVLGGTGKATPSGDSLTGTWVGTIDVQVEIAETKNYLGSTQTVSIDVLQAEPQLELETAEGVYGTDLKLTVSGNEEDGAVTYSLADGETKASIVGDTLTPFTIGDVNICIHIEPTHNYKAGDFTAVVTVKPRPVTVIWTKLEFDYDGKEHVPEATITGLVTGDECSVNVLGAQVNAGTHKAMADSLGNENYTLIGGTDVTTDFTIKPCAVTLSWEYPDFTYNGSMQTPKATVTNLIGNDECTVTVLGTKDAGENLTAMATGLSNSNYTLDGGSNLITAYSIKPLPVELEWTDTELVYNTMEQKPTATVKNLCEGDTCDVNIMGAHTDVGDYTATAFGVSNPNYTVENGVNLTTPYSIVRAPIELSLAGNVLVYGTESALTVDGNLGNGAVTFEVKNGTGTAIAKGSTILPTKVGLISVTATVAETKNYEGGSVTADVAIQPRPVTLVWDEDMEFVYNGEEQAPSARVSDLLESDSCNVTVEGKRDAGRDLVATATSLSNENYTLEGCKTLTTTFTITPLKAELTWGDLTLTYNGKEQAPTATVTNLQGKDECKVEVSGETNAGDGLLASAIDLSNPNYTLEGSVNLTAVFDIKPLAAEIVWKDTKLVYNGEEQAPTASVSNLCEQDTCSVTVNGAEVNAGSYTATAVSLSNTNYTLTGATGISTSYTIDKAERTISLLQAETVYGTALSLTVVGNSENGSVTYLVSGGSGSASMSGNVLTPTRAGEVVLTITVAETANYGKTVASATVTVKPKTIGLSWSNTEFTYDGSEKKPTATATGLIGSESCEVIVSGGQTDAGSYLATASSVANGNYTLTGATDTSCPFVINKATITVTITTTRTTYGTPLKLVLEGNLGNAPVEYSVTEETGTGVVDADGVFTATSFGTVTVTAVVAESKNYYGATTSQKIIIDKGPAPIEITTPNAVYGTPLVLAFSGTDEAGKLTYALQEGTGTGTLSGNILNPTKVGTVTVVVKMTATDTYVETIKSFIVTIKPRPVELAWETTDFTYNGEKQVPKATVNNLVGDDACEVTVTGQIDAGLEQVATATAVSNENYTLEGSTTASTTYVIKQKIVELDWGNTEFVYSGKEQAPKPSVTNLVGSDSCDVTVSGAQVDAGDYFATAASLSNGNYTLEGAENTTSSFHIDRLKVSIVLVPTEAVFGTDLKLEISGNDGNGVVSYSVADDTGSAEISGDTLIPKKVGKVYVTVYVAETVNTYDATTVAEINIKKGKTSVDFAEKSTVYGTSLKLDLTGNEENGDYEFFVTDDTGSAALEGKDTLVPLKAGTVTVKVVVKETANFEETEFEAQFTIKQLTAQLEWVDSVLVYKGEEQAPQVKVTNLVGSDECVVTVSGAKDAGKNLSAKVTALSNDNYTLESAENLTGTFEIAPLKVELEWGETVLEYNGEKQTPKVEILNLQGTDTAETCKLTVSGGEINVGKNYTATVESVSDANYTLEGVSNLTQGFEISKAKLEIEIVADEALYNVPMKLTVKGNVGGGKVVYSVTEGPAIVSEDMLTPTGTGKIVVKAHIDETENYESADAYCTLNAGKGKANYQLTNAIVEYGSDLTLSLSDENGNEVTATATFEVEAGGSGDADISGNVLTATRAGVVLVTVKVEATDLYAESTFTAQVTVTPIVAQLVWEKTQFVYDGNGYVAIASIGNLLSADKGKVEVGVDGTQTDAGTYDATAARLTGENAVNYTLSKDGNTVSFTIEKAEINPTITLSRVYCNVPAEITLDGNLGGGEVKFSVVDGGTGKAEISGNTITPSEEGSVIVKAEIAETKNYKAKTTQAVLVIEKKKITLGLNVTEVVYGSEITLVVTGNEENGKLTFSVVNDTGSATVTESGVLKGTGVGTVNVIITVAETSSYQSTSDTVKVTILPRQITGIDWVVPELVYNGEAQAPVASVSGVLSGDECTVVVSGGQINAGTYAAGTAYASGLSNPNYTLGAYNGATAPEFTIEKADLTIDLKSKTATIDVPFTLEVTGNEGGGTVLYEIVDSESATGAATISGNVLNGTKLGDVFVRITVSATTNYNEAYWNGAITIERPAIPLELTQTEVVYGDKLTLTAKEYEAGVVKFTVKDGGTGDAEIKDNILIPKKAGTVIVVLSVEASDTYQAATAEITVTIKQRPVGVNWEETVLIYNGKEQVIGATLTNVIEGDICDVTVGGAQKDVGKYTATITMLGNSNYVLAEDAETGKEFEIKPINVILEWKFGEYTYNGSEQKPEVSITNLVEGDVCELTVKGTKDASDSATATVTALSNKNYTLDGCENATVTFVIKKKPVSISWDETELIYNGKLQAPVPTIDGLVEGDTCEITVTGENKDVGENYLATAEGIDSTNYALSGTSSIKYSIKPYELVVSADGLTKVYNGDYQTPDIQFVPLNEEDDVDVEIELTGDDGNGVYNVGEYPITLTLVGASKGNYAIKEGEEQLVFKITPMSVSVMITPKDVTVPYEGAPITASDITNWYQLALQTQLAYGETEDELFEKLSGIIKPIIKSGNDVLTEINENGVYILTPDISDESIACGNYAVKLIIDPDDETCDLIVNGESTDVLTVQDDSDYDFLKLEYKENGTYYRRTYKELGIVHGKDDLTVDRLVLGQISQKTSVNKFLNNIKNNKSVRVYSKDGKLLYDRGNPGEGYTVEDLSKWSRLRVTTGSYVEYMKGDLVVEKVYLSVLGDINGDGYITSADTVKIGAYIKKQTQPVNVEEVLAALVSNRGKITAADLAQLNQVIMLIADIEEYFYVPEGEDKKKSS